MPDGCDELIDVFGRAVIEAGALQAIEVTSARQVVRKLATWTEPAKRPATTMQFLDESKAEDVHIGEIR